MLSKLGKYKIIGELGKGATVRIYLPLAEAGAAQAAIAPEAAAARHGPARRVLLSEGGTSLSLGRGESAVRLLWHARA